MLDDAEIEDVDIPVDLDAQLRKFLEDHPAIRLDKAAKAIARDGDIDGNDEDDEDD